MAQRISAIHAGFPTEKPTGASTGTARPKFGKAQDTTYFSGHHHVTNAQTSFGKKLLIGSLIAAGGLSVALIGIPALIAVAGYGAFKAFKGNITKLPGVSKTMENAGKLIPSSIKNYYPETIKPWITSKFGKNPLEFCIKMAKAPFLFFWNRLVVPTYKSITKNVPLQLRKGAQIITE